MSTTRVKLVYSFEATSEHELSANEGDILLLVEDHGDGWSTCQTLDESQTGYVPTAYYEVEPEPEPVKPKRITIKKKSIISIPSISTQKENDKKSNNTSGTSAKATPQDVVPQNQQKDEEEASEPSKEAVEDVPDEVEEKPKERGPKDPRTPREPKYSEKEALPMLQKKLKLYIFKKKFKEYYSKNALFKDLRTRNELLKETLETERTYVSQLSKFVEFFCKPIKEAKSAVVDEKSHKILFSNVEQILSINAMLLADLEKSMSTFPRTNFSSVFKKYGPFLKAYTTYVNNFDEATTLLTRLETTPKFREFLSEAYSNPKLQKHKFDSFSILPIQRIPRYKLLLGDMLKKTPKEHLEYSDLEEALSQISTIATFVNESKRKKEQSQVVLDLSKLLKQKYSSLVQPNRQFLRDGQFKIRVPSRSIIDEPYTAYFFQDVIVLRDSNEKKKSKHKIWFFIFFSVTRVIDKSRTTEITLEVLMEGNLERITMVAASQDLKETWEREIEECVENIMKNKINRGIEQDLMKYGSERISLSTAIKQNLKTFDYLDKEYVNTEKKLGKIEADLRVHEYELRKLQELIRKEYMEKQKMEENLEGIVTNQMNIRTDMQKSIKDLGDHDHVFMNALAEEQDAFKTIFSEEPINEDQQLKMLPCVRAAKRRKSSSSSDSPMTPSNDDVTELPLKIDRPVPPPRPLSVGLSSSGGNRASIAPPARPLPKPIEKPIPPPKPNSVPPAPKKAAPPPPVKITSNGTPSSPPTTTAPTKSIPTPPPKEKKPTGSVSGGTPPSVPAKPSNTSVPPSLPAKPNNTSVPPSLPAKPNNTSVPPSLPAKPKPVKEQPKPKPVKEQPKVQTVNQDVKIPPKGSSPSSKPSLSTGEKPSSNQMSQQSTKTATSPATTTAVQNSSRPLTPMEEWKLKKQAKQQAKPTIVYKDSKPSTPPKPKLPSRV